MPYSCRTLPVINTFLFSFHIGCSYLLTTCPLFEVFLFFIFWLHVFITSINYYSKLCCILIFYQKLLLFKIVLHFIFLPKTCNFCSHWFSTKSLHGKHCWAGNASTFLSSKLLIIFSRGKEPQASKLNNNNYLLASIFEATNFFLNYKSV